MVGLGGDEGRFPSNPENKNSYFGGGSCFSLEINFLFAESLF